MVFEKENKKDKTKENLKKPTTHYYCERRTPPGGSFPLWSASLAKASISLTRVSLSLSHVASLFLVVGVTSSPNLFYQRRTPLSV